MNQPIKKANSAIAALLTASTESSDAYDLERRYYGMYRCVVTVPLMWHQIDTKAYRSFARGQLVWLHVRRSLTRGALLIIDQLFMKILMSYSWTGSRSPFHSLLTRGQLPVDKQKTARRGQREMSKASRRDKSSDADRFAFFPPWPDCTAALGTSPIGSGFYLSDRSGAERP